jgi:tetratricopeptide (TPR) repeat protein
MRRLCLLAIALVASACASNPARKVAVAPGISPAQLEARLAAADALAARGCYLCLREASGAYLSLIAISDSPVVARHALENELMIALREIDLRLPDSGAKDRARAIAVRLEADPTYDAATDALYFSMLDQPAPVPMTLATMRQRDEERKALADKLEAAWPSSALAAYVYIPTAALIGRGAAFKQQAAAIFNAYPHNLAVRYRLQTDPFTYDDAEALAVIAEEPRFAEMRFLRGQRAVARTDLVTGHREYSSAYETLPESLSIAVSYGSLELAFSRFAEALALFDRVLAREPDHEAQLGRAIALSSLKRYDDAIAYLDELLKDASWRPGDKYYWRAWNYLQLGQSQHAYDDANAGLKSMANTNIYQVAGIASYQLTRVPEARADFEESVKMNAANCDSIRYLGIIDAVERQWRVAVARFNAAASCYTGAIAALETELAEKQADTSGLYAGQIPGLVAEIAEAKSLLDLSNHNADVAAKNAP